MLKDSFTGFLVILGTIFFQTEGNHLDIVRFLYHAGAKLDPRTDEGETPLSVAASKGFVDILKFLLECGADKDPRL